MNEEEYGRANKYQNKTNRVNILKQDFDVKSIKHKVNKLNQNQEIDEEENNFNNNEMTIKVIRM